MLCLREAEWTVTCRVKGRFDGLSRGVGSAWVKVLACYWALSWENVGYPLYFIHRDDHVTPVGQHRGVTLGRMNLIPYRAHFPPGPFKYYLLHFYFEIGIFRTVKKKE